MRFSFALFIMPGGKAWPGQRRWPRGHDPCSTELSHRPMIHMMSGFISGGVQLQVCAVGERTEIISRASK